MRKIINDFNPRTSCEVRQSRSPRPDLIFQNFNPRTSCEVRPLEKGFFGKGLSFQSTHLV